MKKSHFVFFVALSALVILCGCKSTPESENSGFDSGAELSSSEGFESSGESFALSDSSSAAFDLGGQVDQEVLGGRSGDDVFIDPSAPAVDSTYTYQAGSDGFVPLRPGNANYNPSYSYSGSSYSSGTGYIGSSSSSSWKSSSSAKASGGTYTVKKGDSLWKIARANGCTVQALADANGISPNGILQIGTKLKIPGGSSKSSASSSSSAASGSTYTVKKGDSYYTIGKKLNVNYLKLMKANGGDDKLKPGQVITIP